jgi:hypothetical protein
MPWSVSLVLVSTPLQVSPIFLIIPCAFIPVFSVCLWPVCLMCQAYQCLFLSEPVYSQPLFYSSSWFVTLACPDPVPAHLTTLPVHDPELACRPVPLLLLRIIDLPWPVVAGLDGYNKHRYFNQSALGSYLDSWFDSTDWERAIWQKTFNHSGHMPTCDYNLILLWTHP